MAKKFRDQSLRINDREIDAINEVAMILARDAQRPCPHVERREMLKAIQQEVWRKNGIEMAYA